MGKPILCYNRIFRSNAESEPAEVNHLSKRRKRKKHHRIFSSGSYLPAMLRA